MYYWFCVSHRELVSEIISKELPKCSPPVVSTDPERESAPESGNKFKVVFTWWHFLFHVTVLVFAVTHSGYKLLLTQYLFNVYSDFIKKQNEICRRVLWACPECFWKCSFSRSCRGQSTAFKNRNFRKLELSLWLIHHEFRSTVQSVWNPFLCFW